MFEPGLGSRVRLKGLALRVNNEGRTDFIVSISQDHQVLFALDLGSGLQHATALPALPVTWTQTSYLLLWAASSQDMCSSVLLSALAILCLCTWPWDRTTTFLRIRNR